MIFAKKDEVTPRRIEFYDKNGVSLLKAGDKAKFDIYYEFTLEDNERIIGVKSEIESYDNAIHRNFAFVIGKMD